MCQLCIFNVIFVDMILNLKIIKKEHLILFEILTYVGLFFPNFLVYLIFSHQKARLTSDAFDKLKKNPSPQNIFFLATTSNICIPPYMYLSMNEQKLEVVLIKKTFLQKTIKNNLQICFEQQTFQMRKLKKIEGIQNLIITAHPIYMLMCISTILQSVYVFVNFHSTQNILDME